MTEHIDKPIVPEGSISASRRRLILILVLIPVFIGALDLTIVSAILPEVLTKLNIPVDANLGSAAWAVSGYLLAYTVSMTVMGRISDLIGRRTVYLVCLGIFIGGSWWVATAHEAPTALLNQIARQVLHERPDMNQLTLVAVIIGRVIQALGAGAMVPVSMALVADLYPPERRAQPVGIIGAMDTLGWVLGHLYGGLMVELFNQHGDEIAQVFHQIGLNWPAPDWHTLFFINVPLSLAALLLTWWVLRGVQHPPAQGRFDLFGAALISLSLIALNIGLGGSTDIVTSSSLTSSDALGNASPFSLPLLAAALACFGIFLLWEAFQRNPLIELHLFRKRNVAAASLTNLLVGFCLMLGLVSAALLVYLRADNASADSIAQAAQKAGILLSGLTIPMALAAIPGGILADRIGYRVTTMLGMTLTAAGFLLAALTWTDLTPDLILGGEMAIAGIGLGLTISPIGTAVINDASDSQRGVASALVIILRLVGMTLAVSALTTFAISRIRDLLGAVQPLIPPSMTPDQIQHWAVHAYFQIGIHVIDELLAIGAIVSLLALLPALSLRGRGQTNL
jgi:MFS family permease